jgi:hypothetical protein
MPMGDGMNRNNRGQWCWLYDGRDLLAAIERHDDGWHVLMHGRDDVGTFATREIAIAFANARKANTPAAAIAGERIADAKRIDRIRFHQRHAEMLRARNSHSQPHSGVDPRNRTEVEHGRRASPRRATGQDGDRQRQ